MTVLTAPTAKISRPTFGELFTPKLVTILREGYDLSNLRSDAIAGLTVAIVALPLSMAIAIASGASPAQGLYTSIIGGFVVSAIGGSRFQIGGPAGAFIVLVAATVQAHGMEGLILATVLSGIMLAAIGLLRLGTYIKFIPYPVTVGFTAGIAVIIFASQIKEIFGLTLGGAEPGLFFEKLSVLWRHAPTFEPAAVAISTASVAVIVGLKKVRPHWPGMLIAVAGAAAATAMFDLPVATIGSKFGGIPNSLPVPSLPDVSLAKPGQGRRYGRREDALRRSDGEQSGGRRLPDLGRLLLRGRGIDRIDSRSDFRYPPGVDHRLRGGAFYRFDGCGNHQGACA